MKKVSIFILLSILCIACSLTKKEAQVKTIVLQEKEEIATPKAPESKDIVVCAKPEVLAPKEVEAPSLANDSNSEEDAEELDVNDDCYNEKFDPYKLSEVFIPRGQVMKESYSEKHKGIVLSYIPYIKYNGFPHYFGEFLASCSGIHLKGPAVYKQFPEGCQILFGGCFDKPSGILCSNRGCVEADFYYLVNPETGEDMPAPDSYFDNPLQ